MFFASAEVKEFCAAMIADPDSWVQGAYHFSHNKIHGFNIWTANGTYFIKIGGNDCLSIWDKRAIAKAIAKTSALKLTLLDKRFNMEIVK